ncbi:diguanylate cyclase (GGDEF)-like protein [Kibdelosporangium banguiense]|uniref:Diguanylate cyclase (GGDEF)-like protein n=1 Tax=Kibdelosporangium banguiense TaxID=1365924 RepID=A0ABS4T9C8_9PSEU|nr:tetratricopeptide repeat-containing diguanylate cyclase [Kibdelosporangium banguiense]MBP2321031.1 diguanylate cyclase (GGDEF)-like protein [Kibdelosporangium banguiense]
MREGLATQVAEVGLDQDEQDRAGEILREDLEIRLLLNTARHAEAGAKFDKSLEIIPADLDHWSRAAILTGRAITAWRLGRIPLALELAAEGWTDIDAEQPVAPLAARAMGYLGYLLNGIGHAQAALTLLRQAVDVARDCDDVVELAVALQKLGGTLNFMAFDGPAAEAPPLFTEARTALAEGLALPDVSEQIQRGVLGAYGAALVGCGEFAEGEKVAKQVLEAGVSHGDRWSVAVGNWVLAMIRRDQGSLVEARTHASNAVRQAELTNDTSLLQRFSADLADICAELDDFAGEATALRRNVSARHTAMATMQEGLGQALEQRRLAIKAQRLASVAQAAAVRDSLTGLTNRLGLERTAPEVLAGAAAINCTPWLVLIDVDWFKEINDDAGHAVGDSALREIADLLRGETRANDLVARWAGDEFIILLVGDGHLGFAVAERIRAAVDAHDWRSRLGAARRPTVSIGVASGHGSLEHLFAAADTALYLAKRNGRNRVEWPDLDQAMSPPVG